MVQSYPTAGPVIYFETDFIEKGQAFLQAAKQSLRIMQQRLTYVSEQISVIIDTEVRDNTPVGPDSWNHVGGSLQRSTDVLVYAGDQGMIEGGTSLGDVVEQYVVQVTQDATNPYGTQYAPFVIQGHYSRAGNWVTENPYPLAALEMAWPEINALLDGVAREIGEETVRYLADYANSPGLTG